MATRWGICSAGNIAHDFCAALKVLPESEHEVVAVAARGKERADSFARKFGISAAYGSYEDLAKDSTVEIVYVGTIHPQHHAACMLFLEHGKHVLCEKPMAITLKECKEVINKAREKGLFFMEGFWTRFFPAVGVLREELKSGSLGNVNFLRAGFCVSNKNMERITKKELGGGGLLDLGCYVVQYANLVFRDKPDKIMAVGNLNEEGVDAGGTIVLHYKTGGTAILYYHTDCKLGGNTLSIYGSTGYLEIPEPIHCPTKIQLPSGEIKVLPLPDTPGDFVYMNSVGLTYEARCVRDCLKQGLTECPLMQHDDSISIMEVMEEALRQIGVEYSR